MHKVVLAVMIAAVALIVASKVIAQSPPRPSARTWEYQEIKLETARSSLPAMNQLGSEGWELVNVVAACTASEMTRDCEWWAYLKRPRS